MVTGHWPLQMTLPLFIANRYLRSKRKNVEISVISVIAVLGVATGVMALVVALAVTNGMRNMTQRTFLAAQSHVMIEEATRGPGIENWQAIAARLAKIDGVTSATPALYDVASVTGPINSQGLTVKGIAPERGGLPEILERLKEGSIQDLAAQDGMPGIVLGVESAKQLGAVVGKTVTLLIPNGNPTPYGPRPRIETVRVAGVFETGMYAYDNSLAFLALGELQRLWNYPDIVNSIELRLDDIYRSEAVAAAARPVLDKGLAAITWQRQNRQILETFRFERSVTQIIIGLIQLVAALNILTVLVMLVMEKQRDIAILLSMGAKANQIRRIFVWQGAILGGIGTLLGLLAGYTICYFADRYQWLQLDQAIYSLKYVPFETNAWDAVWVTVVAIGVSLLATLYPAMRASRVLPVEAMRYE
jgi:lipoprotein-releasing system permease protein